MMHEKRGREIFTLHGFFHEISRSYSSLSLNVRKNIIRLIRGKINVIRARILSCFFRCSNERFSRSDKTASVKDLVVFVVGIKSGKRKTAPTDVIHIGYR